MKKAILGIAVTLMVAACGGGDSNDGGAVPTQPDPTPTPTPTPTPEPTRPTYEVNRTDTQWIVSHSTSALDGKKTTLLTATGLDGINFRIACVNGSRSYYVTTDFVTGSGSVSYRIGSNPVRTEVWNESTSFKAIFPTAQNTNPSIYLQLYQNWDLVFEVHRFGGGMRQTTLRADGFPAVVNKTRSECGWEEDEFPSGNGWSGEIPDNPPHHAVDPIYYDNAINQFGWKAWRQYDEKGNAALLVRVGEDLSLCGSRSVISSKSFYVTQNGKEVSAVPGFYLGLSCKERTPFTLVLQGDFNPAEPLIISTYPSLYSTAISHGVAMASAQF